MPRDRATEDAQDLFTRGHRALDAGDFREAVECFSRAIRLRPNVSDVYRLRAYAYLEMGDRARALNDLDQAIRLKPADATGYADRAAELHAQRQFDQAIADCDRALRLDPSRVSLIGLRARCHADGGNSGAAFKDFAEAIEADPKNAAMHRLFRAKLHLDLEDFDGALADAAAVIAADPKNAEAYFLRGNIRQGAGDFPGAAEDFSATLAAKPDHVFARLGRAICRLVLNDPVGAAADADLIVTQMPGAVRGYEVRGRARKLTGDLTGALADFDKAVELAPLAVPPLMYRAGVHYARHNYGLAIRDHTEALKRDPRSAATFNHLAWIWATCPDPDVRNGRQAHGCATRACELTEWVEPSFLDTLAAACAECGEFEDAVKWQEKAIGMLTDEVRRADYESRLDLYRAGRPVRAVGE
jgi:serine/threonine-protein kinase